MLHTIMCNLMDISGLTRLFTNDNKKVRAMHTIVCMALAAG